MGNIYWEYEATPEMSGPDIGGKNGNNLAYVPYLNIQENTNSTQKLPKYQEWLTHSLTRPHPQA